MSKRSLFDDLELEHLRPQPFEAKLPELPRHEIRVRGLWREDSSPPGLTDGEPPVAVASYSQTLQISDKELRARPMFMQLLARQAAEDAQRALVEKAERERIAADQRRAARLAELARLIPAAAARSRRFVDRFKERVDALPNGAHLERAEIERALAHLEEINREWRALKDEAERLRTTL